MVDEAVEALKVFLNDPEMEWLKNNLKDAEGVLIVPSLIKAGFIIGGSGGRGVLLAHDKKTNQRSRSSLMCAKTRKRNDPAAPNPRRAMLITM